MRTTLDIPEKLLAKAMKITKSKTKSETIRRALEEVVRKDQRLKLLTLRGKVDLNLDLDVLRGRDRIDG